jgi:hypothetical protein
MKTKLENVYQCDHCNKKMRSAGAMSRHEKYCNHNPINKHICFEWCKHLKKERVDILYTDPETRETEVEWSKIEFTCLAKNVKMYSFLLEKKKAFKPEFIEGIERMPLDCNKYEVMYTNEYGQYSHEMDE